MITGQSFSENIVLRDEDGITVRQLIKILSGIQVLNIHGAGMISGSVRPCACTRPLDFKIILFPTRVCCITIETQGSCAGKSFQIFLGFQFCHNKIINLSQYPQNELSKRNVIPEDASHKVIVNRPQTAQAGQIFLAFTCFAILLRFVHIGSLRHVFHPFVIILHAICEEFKNIFL